MGRPQIFCMYIIVYETPECENKSVYDSCIYTWVFLVLVCHDQLLIWQLLLYLMIFHFVISHRYLLEVSCFLMRRRRGVDPEEMGVREELGGVERNEIII